MFSPRLASAIAAWLHLKTLDGAQTNTGIVKVEDVST